MTLTPTTTLSLPITVEGLDTLAKTIGIALANLSMKLDKAPYGSAAARTAAKDRTQLLLIQQEVTALCLEIEDNGEPF